MIVNRLIYVITLVSSFFFYLLYPPWISWFIFALIVAMIPFDLLVSLPGMMSKNIQMYAPPVLEKGDSAVLKLITTERKPYPVRCIIAKLSVSGDGFSVMCSLKCSAKADEQRDMAIDTSHSGVTIFELKRLSSVSMLGLFSLPVNVNEKKAVLVLPPPLKPANTGALQQGMQLKPKPGGGFSEEHDMRTYQQGDPVRNIHWKASAKFDSLIIREPLVPPLYSRLIHIKPWETVSDCDITLGRLRWVSDFLLKWETPFYIKYGENIDIMEITHEKDLIVFLCNVLPKTDDKTYSNAQKIKYVPSRFSWIFHVDASNNPNPLKKEAKK